MVPIPRLQALTAFLPGTLVRELTLDEARPREGAVTHSLGVTLFADISGFTPLAEALEREGPGGAERLTERLNQCFGPLLDSILAHGGDVLRFAGDAVLVLWPASSPQELVQVARLAVQCAVDLQATVERTQASGAVLRLRVGIGTGTVYLADMGGDLGRWEYLTAGPPLREMAHAEHAAEPGQIVVSARTWECVAPFVEGEELADGQRRVVRIGQELLLPRVRTPEPTPRMEPAIRAYLPEVVLRRLDAGHTQWLSEFRNASVLFINLCDPELSEGTRLPDLQRAFLAIQGALHRRQGRANQLLVDDKGVVVVAAFGLPTTTHEDDAARAVQVACDIHTALTGLGIAHGIGVTSGRLFCGVYGATRREYVTVGRVVNLSARLMQAARNEVLCDAATVARAGTRLRFEALAPLRVKGKAEPVEVFRPFLEEAGPRARMATGSVLVGRGAEQEKLAQALRALEAGTGGVLLLEGEAGLGKSQLLSYLAERAEAAGFACCLGAGEASYKAATYHAFGPPLSKLFGLEGLPELETRTARMLKRLDPWPELREWAPLLNDILPVAIPETEGSRAVSGPLRASNLRNLLLQLLHDEAEARPLVLMLDDVQWMDSSSWELAYVAQRRLRRMLLVLAGRPQSPESTPPELRQLREQPGAVLLSMEALSPDEVHQLACQRLGVGSLPAEVVEFIRDKGEGNPFFSGELACALRDAGHLEIVDGECRVSNPSQLRMLNLPTTVQGLLSSRIDRLSDPQQLTLKVASVVGRMFAMPVLEGIYPVEADKELLSEHVEALAHADLTPREPMPPESTYGFKHILIQEVAYEMLPFAQRRQLHKSLAQLYERGLGGQAEAVLYPRLSLHWKLADVPEKALEYLEMAAQSAFIKGGSREALAFFSQVQELLHAHPELKVAELRRASWKVTMAQACQRLGEERDFDPHVEEADRLLGLQLPRTQGGWFLRLGRELLRHTATMLFPRWFHSSDDAEARLRRELRTRLATTVSERSYLRLNLPAWFTCVVTAINEAGRDHALAGTTYYTLGFIVGLLRLAGLSRIYERRSMESRDPAVRAAALTALGYMHAGFGRWDKCQEMVRSGLGGSQHLNDWYNVGISLEILTEVEDLLHGAGGSLKPREQLLALGRENASLQLEAWALRGLATSLLALGKPVEALERLREHEAHLPRLDPLTELGYRGTAAAAWYHAGDPARARLEADKLLVLISKSPMLSLQALEPLHAFTETCLALLEDEGAQALPETRTRAVRALKVLRTCAWLLPVGRAYHQRLLGTMCWLEGEHRQAEKHWQRALASARAYGLEYAEALVLMEWGGRAREPETRARYLEDARRMFTRMGCAYRLQRLDQLEKRLLTSTLNAA